MSRTARAPQVPTPFVLFLWLLGGTVAGCGGATDPEPPAPSPPPAGPASGAPADLLVDRAAETGLDFVHFHGATGKRWMAEVMGSGVALLDYDRDGDLDVYLVQGAPLAPGETVADALVPPRHPIPLSDRLYRNDLEPSSASSADGSVPLAFTDVTESSGLAALARGYGMGAAAGDVDGDGFPDLYVTALGENLLLRNRGDGTFEDVTAAAGAGDARWSVPAVLFDREGDGDLDLFIGNYVAFPMDEPPDCRDSAGRPDYCGPSLYPPQGDRLLENRGDGTFRDVTVEVGLADPGVEPGRALGAVAEDLDGDGRRDLFVANDGMRNHLWLFQEDGTYREAALAAGLAVDGSGREEGSMGIAVGDPDGDGDPDLLLTHLVTETNTLYLNAGPEVGRGLFTDASGPSGLGSPSRRHTGFGTGFFDLDGDGRLELLTVNGAVQNIEALVTAGDPFPLHETNQLFRLVGPEGSEAEDGAVPRFEEITRRGGTVFELSEVSRGAAFGDVDNDGDTDVVVTHNGGPVRLLINRAADGARWLGFSLFTGDPPRYALGARVELLQGGEPIAWRRAAADGSYASSSDPRVLFSLGRSEEPMPEIDGLRVTWPDGTVEERAPPELGAYVGRYTVMHQDGVN